MDPLWICAALTLSLCHTTPQGSVLPLEQGAEDPDVPSGDAQEPGGDGSSEQETDTTCDTSSSQDEVRTLGTMPASECGAGEVSQVPRMSPRL